MDMILERRILLFCYKCKNGVEISHRQGKFLINTSDIVAMATKVGRILILAKTYPTPSAKQLPGAAIVHPA